MAEKLLTVLRKDHRMVKEVMDAIEQSGTKSTQKKARMWANMQELLIPHMEAEEQVVYPALLEANPGNMPTLEGIEEHRMAKVALKELQGMDMDEERWQPLFSVLSEMLAHHVKEEEDGVFEEAEKLGETELEALAERFTESKAKAADKMAKKR